jgi:hypothetical protein
VRDLEGVASGHLTGGTDAKDNRREDCACGADRIRGVATDRTADFVFTACPHPHELFEIKAGEFLIFVATIALWWATRRLVKGADATAERQLRAYVLVKNGRIDRLSAGILRADITLENGGQTPARDLVYKGRTFIGTLDNPEEIGPFTEDLVIIGPRSQSPIVITSRTPFTIENQYAYAAGDLKIIVRGALKYRDAFNNIQTTEFGFEAYGDIWGSGGHLRPIKGENKAT